LLVGEMAPHQSVVNGVIHGHALVLRRRALPGRAGCGSGAQKWACTRLRSSPCWGDVG
jgi:hypothetical protein